MNSSVTEFVREEVPDWDDEVITVARFKAFSGQRLDWEPRFFFWRDLILKVARHLGVFIIQPSEVRNSWFNRGGLTPLCIDHVLLEMYNAGDVLQRGDLLDPRSRRPYQMFRRLSGLIGISRPSASHEIFKGRLILRPLMQEKAAEIIKLLSENHWTSNCVLTMEKFQSMCESSDEASAILSYLLECGKARYVSINKKDFIEGVKISLGPVAVPSISSLDFDTLHLIWTSEKLQQQLDVIDRRYEKSRKLALDSVKSGNKQVALRYMRQLKLISESREKCTSFLHRLEEVLGVIANAESTKKVSEAIQIGAEAIKENAISVDEVHSNLQELDDIVAKQREVEDALESRPLQYTDIDEEDVEEEFKTLELELGREIPQVELNETVSATAGSETKVWQSGKEAPQVQITKTVSHSACKEEEVEESADSLSQTLSKLNLEAA